MLTDEGPEIGGQRSEIRDQARSRKGAKGNALGLDDGLLTTGLRTDRDRDRDRARNEKDSGQRAVGSKRIIAHYKITNNGLLVGNSRIRVSSR